jgi:hypothetical protein
MFRVNNASSFGASLRGEVLLPPAFMIERFGDQRGGDRTNCSGSWMFESETGEVFTVYDWHCTSQPDCLISGLPTIEEFWASWEPFALHIGGMPGSDWQAFRRWLQAECRAYCNAQAETGQPARKSKTRRKSQAD